MIPEKDTQETLSNHELIFLWLPFLYGEVDQFCCLFHNPHFCN